MKKIITVLAAAGVIAAMGAGQVFAAGESVSLESKNGDVSFSYSVSEKESTYKVNKIFKYFSGATTARAVTDTVEITSVSKTPVALSLRISANAEVDASAYSPVDYYDIVVTAADDEVIYSDVVSSGKDGDSKEIPLGTFNTHFSKDVKKYNISAIINENAAKVLNKTDGAKYDVYVVAKEAAAVQTASPAPTANTGSVVLTPDTPAATAAVGTGTVNTPAPTISAAPTTAPTNTPAPTADPRVRVKKCDEDLKEGQYKVSGRGEVVITDEDGKIISQNTVRPSKEANTIAGVDEFKVTLRKGYTVTATAIGDDKKPDIKFEYLATTTATAKPSTAKSAAKVTAKPTATAKTSSKTNPKTGDAGLAIGVVIALMVLAGVSVGGMEVYKRKKKN